MNNIWKWILYEPFQVKEVRFEEKEWGGTGGVPNKHNSKWQLAKSHRMTENPFRKVSLQLAGCQCYWQLANFSKMYQTAFWVIAVRCW